jgi:tetratricopeptide (TPR) repeat protein
VVEIEQALAQAPDQGDANLYFNLGYARNQLGEPLLAVDAYEAALALDPDDSPSRWNLALTYRELALYSDARSHFERYLELNPGEADEVQPYLEELRQLAP